VLAARILWADARRRNTLSSIRRSHDDGSAYVAVRAAGP
jgi:hypothetical protein